MAYCAWIRRRFSFRTALSRCCAVSICVCCSGVGCGICIGARIIKQLSDRISERRRLGKSIGYLHRDREHHRFTIDQRRRDKQCDVVRRGVASD